MSWETWAVTILNACLVFILTLLLKPIGDYVKNLLREVKSFRKEIKELKYKIDDEITHELEKALHKIYSLEKDLRESLNKLRRSMGSTVMGLRKGREEISQILDMQRKSQNKLDSFERATNIGVKIFKVQESRLKSLESSIVKLNKEIIIIKGSGNGK